MEAIRIKAKSGKLITRRAIINDARQFPAAQVGVHLYRIAYRDSTGPVWAVSKE